MMAKIFLIGMPGSGKSTLGKELANHFGTRFIDLDVEIEHNQGSSVPNIFSVHGEEHFRMLEHQMLKACTDQSSNFVMATGGGTPCFHNNIDLMNAAGVTIFLDVPISEIVHRLKIKPRHERPLLAGVSPDQLPEKLQLLRATRLTHYERAKITVSSPNPTLRDVIARLEGEAQSD